MRNSLQFKNEEKEFNEVDILRFFRFGNKFLAGGWAKDTILSIFVEYLSNSSIEIPIEFKFWFLWKEFGKFFNAYNSTIKVCSNEIQLYGLRVKPGEKTKNFMLLENLTKFYDNLVIKNIPLDENDVKSIQNILKSSLTGIYFENCPFNFEIGFDFSHLTTLTQFHCKNCYADSRIISIFDSPISSLIHLEISGNRINPENNNKIVEFIEKQTKLEFLNISWNNFTAQNALELFKVLFQLSALKTVDLIK